jgi:transposase
MRYELSDYEWTAIKPMLPNKPRGVRRVNDVACSMASFGSCVQVRQARPAGELRSPDHLLQSLRSVAAGWRLGPDHGCPGRWS